MKDTKQTKQTTITDKIQEHKKSNRQKRQETKLAYEDRIGQDKTRPAETRA